jgi:hypothetical protein
MQVESTEIVEKTPIHVSVDFKQLPLNEACGPISVSGLTGELNTSRLLRVGCIS